MAYEEYLRGLGNEFESEAMLGAWVTLSSRVFFFFSSNLLQKNPGQKNQKMKAKKRIIVVREFVGLGEDTAVSFTSLIRKREYKGGRWVSEIRVNVRAWRVCVGGMQRGTTPI